MKSKISRTRSLRKLAPVLRPKSKKRPRGKPFAKGNTFGVATRFGKGTSANPGGRPRSAEVSKASREWLAEPVTLPELLASKLPAELEGWTHAAVLAWLRGQGALAGSLSDAQEITDRAEGKPGTALRLETGADPLADLLAEVRKVSQQIGPPENEGSEEENQQ